MKAKNPPCPDQMQFLMPDLARQLDPRQPLYQLAQRLPWEQFSESFERLYSHTGRPAKPIRLMVGLLILKQLHNLSDEKVVEVWVQNPYFQYFCGQTMFQWQLPCEPTDLIHFRHRIGVAGVEQILKSSIELHGDKGREQCVIADTTVQEKNITFPTDNKLRVKIIERCVKIAAEEGIVLRRSYRRTVPKLGKQLYHAHHPKRQKQARRAARQLKTIAGRLVRELERKMQRRQDLFQHHGYEEQLELFKRVLHQKRTDKNKIYSLHEPEVYCVAKGKDHKKYEFGCKVSLVMTQTDNVILGALNFTKNEYDGNTLKPALEQVEQLTGHRPQECLVDKGYRGVCKLEDTRRVLPGQKGAKLSRWQRYQLRKKLRRRQAIEPQIGHLKVDYGMGRNFLKGVEGDALNVLLAAAAMNFSKWMRKASFWLRLWVVKLRPLFKPMVSAQYFSLTSTSTKSF